LQDDLLRLEAYKADLSHLNLSLSNLIAQLVGANSSAAPLLITQNNASGRGEILSSTVTVNRYFVSPGSIFEHLDPPFLRGKRNRYGLE
jgi:hypothetical protein